MGMGDNLAQVLNSTFIENKDRIRKLEIKDIPIMAKDDGTLVCIPKKEEVFASAICGSSGTGKSLLLHRISEYLYHHWNYNVCNMNDVSEETYKWSEPGPKKFKKENERWIEEDSITMPICYVYPSTNTLDIDESLLSNKSFIKITLPFQEIIENIELYLNSINPQFEIGKAGMYINNIKKSLEECDIPSQVFDILDNELPGKKGYHFKTMRIKIKNAFETLFKEKLLDITNPEYPAYLKYENKINTPLNTLMKAGYIPSLITSDINTKKYKSEIFAYYIKSIFENHIKTFPNKKTFLIFDELKEVCRYENESSTKELSRVAARGRIKNVGLVYATQFYNQIPSSIKGAKLNYLFCFQHNEDKILTDISKDFDLDRGWKKVIKSLKKFEVVAMTKSYFICYKDDEKWREENPIRGFMLFPLSNHKKPGEK